MRTNGGVVTFRLERSGRSGAVTIWEERDGTVRSRLDVPKEELAAFVGDLLAMMSTSEIEAVNRYDPSRDANKSSSGGE